MSKSNRPNLKLLAAFLFVFIMFHASFSVFAITSIMGKRKIKTLSDKKVLKIEKIVQRSFAQNEDANYDDVKNAILGEVKVVFPVNMHHKLLKVNYNKIEKESFIEADKKFPLSDKKLENKFKKDADKIFLPAKLNSKVTVKYKIGNDKLLKVTGYYRGLNMHHNGILIDDKVIPVFDLIPEDKAKFISSFRELRKNTFIKEKIKTYLAEKEVYTVKTISDKIKQIAVVNEKNGYIYAWRQWRTPVETAEMIYKYYLVQKLKEKNEAVEKDQKEKQEQEAATENKKNSSKSEKDKGKEKAAEDAGGIAGSVKKLLTNYHGTVGKVLEQTKVK